MVADRAPVARAGVHDLRHRGTARHLRVRGIPAGAGAQGVRGPAQRDRPAGLGADPAAHQHPARQAHPAGRLHHPAPPRCSTACPTPPRCPRPPPPATRSSRCGAGQREVRSLQEWHEIAREMPRDGRHDRGPRARPSPPDSARGSGARSGRPSRSRATPPTGSAGPPPSCCPERRGCRRGPAVRRTAGRALVRARSRLQPPAARRGARRARHPARARVSTGWSNSGTAAGGSGRAAAAARRPQDGGGGVCRAAPVRRGAGHGRWRRVHECRLPRRRLGRGGGVASLVVDAGGGDQVLPAGGDPLRATGRAAWRAGSCWRRSCGSSRTDPDGNPGGSSRAVPLAPGGHPVQPALLRQRLQEPRRAELEAARRGPGRPGSSSRRRGSRASGSAARRSRRCTPTIS